MNNFFRLLFSTAIILVGAAHSATSGEPVSAATSSSNTISSNAVSLDAIGNTWYERLAMAFGEAAWNEAEGSAKTWLRQQVMVPEDLDRYGLVLDDGWHRRPAHLPVVIHVHGFNSTAERTAELFSPIQQAGYPCGYISYPNDHSLEASTELVSKHLKSFTRRYPNRQLVLVCHSMGSLVARGCVENPRLDPGNVERLIMVAPPTHGSYLAHLSVGSDLWEHWLAKSEGWPWERVHDSIVDGLGEASVDLCPDSPYLRELNARSRNPRIDYSILLGTTGVMTEDDRQSLRESLKRTLDWIPGTEESARELDKLLADFDELVHGKGDGVVAVSRGRLAGVADTVLLPFGHLKFSLPDENPGLPLVHREVLERIR